MPVSEQIPPTKAVAPTVAGSKTGTNTAQPRLSDARSRSAEDGTLTLLRTGFWITLGGLLALLSTQTLFGGIGIQGAHSNAGWLALMFALMGIPFGLMLLVLGIAKWLRNRSLDR